MTDPKLVIDKVSWDDMTPKQQSKITYDTVISMREDVIELTKKVNVIINKPPLCPIENRVDKLEKGKFFKSAIAFLGGVVGGFGGSHIPK